MAADGSIVIAAKMNVGQAEKDLAKLKGKIEKTENDIASITKKRDEASEKGALGAEQLEKERQKLQEMKKSLEELKASAKEAKKATSGGNIADTQNLIAQLTRQRGEANQQRGLLGGQLDAEKIRLEELKAGLVDLKTEYADLQKKANDKFLRRLSPVEADKAKEQAAEQAAKITQQNAEIKEQQKLVNALQKEFDRVDSSVDKYNQKLEVATYKLQQQKESAASSTAGMAAAEQLPAMQEAVQEQQRKVNALQSEWNKAHNSVERYNQQLSDANARLDKQKAEAGQLSDNIEAAKQAQRGFGAATAAAGEFADKLGKRIQRLASRVFVFTMITAALRSLRTWLGNVINTNDEARAAIARLQGALLTLAQPLVQVIIPAFTAFVNLLAAIVSRIAQFVSMIFGTTVKDSAKAAKGLNATAKGYGSVAKQAEKAAKSLAGFDEIEQLQAPEEADTGSGSGGGGGLGDIAPDFGFLDGVTERLQKIADLVLLIAAGLALWSIGYKLGGPLGDILKLLGGVLMTVGGILLAWDGLTDAWENGVDWGNMAEMIAGVAAAAFGLYQVFMVLNPALAPIAGGIALHDAMENGWNLQNTLLSIAGIMATGLGIALIAGPGGWIAVLIAAIASLLLAFTVATGHGEELIAGIQEVIQGFKDFFTGIFTGDMTLAMQGIEEIFNGLGTAVNAVIDGLKDTFDSFLDWLNEKTGGKLKPLLDLIKGIFDSTFDAIKLVVSDLMDSFKQIFNGIVEFVSGVFTGDWDRAWEGVKDVFKGIWNGIVAILEGAANLIIDGINWIIEKVSGLHIDIPAFLGGGSIGINIPTIQHISIPRLAQGAVIPANREFLAVLGDQRHGTNIEAPLETIQEAVRVELQGQIDAMMAGFEAVVAAIQNKDMDVYIGDESIGRAATRYQDRMSFIGGY